MANTKKARPSQIPGAPRSLEETLKLAIIDPREAPGLRVILRIGGGLKDQFYSFFLEASSSGTVDCELRCAFSKRSGRARKKRITLKRFARLLQEIYASGVLKASPEPTGFLPDTVVGCLEVVDGQQSFRTYFAADRDQAETQKRPVPDRLERALEAVYALGAEVTGLRSVKP